MRVYSQDAAVVAAAVPTVMVAAGMLVFDGMQGVLMSALRGAGDVWLPVLFHGIAFWGFMVPGAAIFAFFLRHRYAGPHARRLGRRVGCRDPAYGPVFGDVQSSPAKVVNKKFQSPLR